MRNGGDFLRRWLHGGGAHRVEPSPGRAGMLERLLEGGVHDPVVLEAMATVPREEFVTEGHEGAAYADSALPIGCGQTISQPLMVGILVQALKLQKGDRVLDVGTGSGYQAAVIAACGARVTSIERFERLAAVARMRLARLGIDVEVVTGDGTLGVPERAPFDAVAVAAASPWPPPLPLLQQLAPGGRLVIPMHRSGDEDERLIRFWRVDEDGTTHWPHEDLGPCRFVPLIGEAGYSPDEV